MFGRNGTFQPDAGLDLSKPSITKLTQLLYTQARFIFRTVNLTMQLRMIITKHRIKYR